jgi:hypothetical protein
MPRLSPRAEPLVSRSAGMRRAIEVAATGDGYRMDKAFRVNESLQRFFDLSAGIETTYALPAASGG